MRGFFTDRGTGMYSPGGQIVGKYEEALRLGGWRSFFGADASKQAPDMGDMLLHETAVSWVRWRLRSIKPRSLPWEESDLQWKRRMQLAVEHANSKYRGSDLCHSFPARLQKCVDADGGRLRS